MQSGDIGPYAAMALVIGFGILEIVLLAGTAFAVGARRQTRELGLVMAAGGTPRDVRRIVLLQGLFAGAGRRGRRTCCSRPSRCSPASRCGSG